MFDFRGVLPFLLFCGAVLGAIGVGIAVALWRLAWWIFQHIQWVP
jgi:hypothetical protein